jgi:hypothetical protein
LDGSSYSGSISGFIPYSGTFKIIGSGSYLKLENNVNRISGFYLDSLTPNLSLEDMVIDCSGLNGLQKILPENLFDLNNQNKAYFKKDELIVKL